MKIHTENMCGNLHEVATTINKRGWAQYLVTMNFNGGNYTVAVFRMPDSMVYKLRRESPSYMSDPHHDDVPHLPTKVRKES